MAFDRFLAMAFFPRIREQHIAVFGESGSGKTVLVSSFLGAAQEGSYSSDLWDLVADDTGQGQALYRNYLRMREKATPPQATRFRATTYYFSVKLKGGDGGDAKSRPFDMLRLAWHDYPGEWFTESPDTAEEIERRTDTFRSLLRSDVALLLIDGQKLLDHAGEEEKYLKSLFFNVRQALLRLGDDLLAEEGKLVEFPRIWTIALSKADLLPDWDVYRFRDLMIEYATDDLQQLRETLQGLVDTPEAMSVGEDFVLLSSAKFEGSPGHNPVKIDTSHRIGLDLILPIASILPLERRVQWASKMDIPQKVLDKLADGAEALAAVIVGGQLAGWSKLLNKVPKVGPLNSKTAAPLVAAAVALAGAQLKKVNEEARAQHDYLTATLTQFKLDLERGVEQRILIRSLH